MLVVLTALGLIVAGIIGYGAGAANRPDVHLGPGAHVCCHGKGRKTGSPH